MQSLGNFGSTCHIILLFSKPRELLTKPVHHRKLKISTINLRKINNEKWCREYDGWKDSTAATMPSLNSALFSFFFVSF